MEKHIIHALENYIKMITFFNLWKSKYGYDTFALYVL
jgi:hypothetical protein